MRQFVFPPDEVPAIQEHLTGSYAMSQEVIAEDSLRSAQGFEGDDRVIFKYCSISTEVAAILSFDLLFISYSIVTCFISQEQFVELGNLMNIITYVFIIHIGLHAWNQAPV